MKIKLHTFLGMLLLSTAIAHAQQFRYKRILRADSAGWNRIYIPPQLEAKCRTDFADLRVLAITKNGDTVEAPYSIKDPGNNVVELHVPLKIINRSEGNGGFYYSFEKTGRQNIEEIELDFELKNFDFRVKLEGSHNQKEWFTLLNDYRILSIHNQATDYAFTKLVFPEASYPFYRLHIPAASNPRLVSAATPSNASPKARMHVHKILSRQSEVNRELKQTIVTIKLAEPLPVSHLQVHTPKQDDYIRNTLLFQLKKDRSSSADTVKHYAPSGNFVLSSLGSNSFQIPKILTSEIRLVVENKDNEPLRIDNVTLKTMLQEIWVRLPEAKSYLLVYGNNQANMPQYDAAQILEQTNPAYAISAIVGEEEPLAEIPGTEKTHWFEKDIYLYGLMALIIALLGYFSLTMMRKKQNGLGNGDE